MQGGALRPRTAALVAVLVALAVPAGSSAAVVWANGYDPYWGALAPQTDGGHWYSFDVAGWHFVSLNSEEDQLAEIAAQADFIDRDLAPLRGSCTIAVMHYPRYSAR